MPDLLDTNRTNKAVNMFDLVCQCGQEPPKVIHIALWAVASWSNAICA